MARREKEELIVMEGAEIIFRNFSGRKSDNNPSGNKNFAVIINPADVDNLTAAGWNIRMLEPRDEDGEPTYIMNVFIKYDSPEAFIPEIYQVTKRRKTLLNDSTVCNLDAAEIQNIDLIIRPYDWKMGNKSGRKAMVKSMYVTIVEDQFAEKYRFEDEDENTPF